MTIEYKDSKRITAVSSDWTADVTSNITWSTTGKVGWDISGTTISRTGSDGWGTSKIQSTDTFTVGDGAFMIEFSGIDNNLNSTMIGFNKGTLGYYIGSPQNQNDFSIYVAGGSRVEVYESGSKNYDSGGSRNANDKFRIEVNNSGVVKYYLQEGGTGSFDLKYTSSTTASGTYFIQANAYASTSEATVHSKTVATAVAKPTDVQDNSILVEKDTGRRYWYDGSYWSPKLPTITGLILHLDASDMTTITKDGSNNLSQWNDKSGQGNNVVQATLANQPVWTNSILNSMPVIRFIASNNETIKVSAFTGGAESQPNTVIMVGEGSQGTGRYIFDSGAASTRAGITSDGTYVRMYAGAESTTTITNENGTPRMWRYEFNGTSSKVEKSGTGVQTINGGTGSTNGIVLGNYQGEASGNAYDGDIAEFLFYNKILSAQELSDIETYLTDKWGL